MTSINAPALTEQETEAVISQVNQAEKNHVEWLARLHEHIICNGPLPDNVCDKDAYHHCQFGQWFYNETSVVVRNTQCYQELGVIHREMHLAARQLIHSWQKNNKIDVNEYQDFISKQHRLLENLTALRENLNITLMSYDNLTGALRRNPFMMLFEKELSQAKRSDATFCITMMDLDYFKKVNDSYGHLVGDKVLQKTSQTISQGLRTYDSLCRYGGEEFIVLLPDTKLDEAKKVLERVRKNVEEQIVDTVEGQKIQVTISAGMTEVDNNKSLSENIDIADKALYKAKSEGRNRVICL